MRHFLSLTVIFLVLGLNAFSASLAQADSLFRVKDYESAAKMYETLMLKKPNDQQLIYKVGQSYLFANQTRKAVQYLKTLSDKSYKDSKYLYIDALILDYRFEEAQMVLQSLSTSKQGYDTLLYTQKMEQLSVIKKMLQKVENVYVLDSLRLLKSDFLTYFQPSSEIGKLFVYNQLTSANGIQNDYGFITQRQEEKYLVLRDSVQTDIYKVNKLIDGWSDKLKLSNNINSSYNENYPFVMSDGITMYFGSNGKASIGGYDIFLARFSSQENDYMSPINIGLPYNSPYNDYLYVVDEENQCAWLATDRFQAADSMMLYKLALNNEKSYVSDSSQSKVLAFAQLKKYDIVAPKVDSISLNDEVLPISNADLKTMLFVINDTIVYRSLEDFKSIEAKNTYTKAVDEENKLVELKEKMRNKRDLFRTASSVAQKDMIGKEIVQLELQQNLQIKKPKELYLLARQLELKYIQSTIKK